MLESLFNKVGALRACNFINKAPTQKLSCEICKFFESNYFEEYLWMSASKLYLKRNGAKAYSCEFSKLFINTYFVEDLQTAGSETPLRGSFFNKVISLTAWRLLTVLERDCRTGVSLCILRNLQESSFSEHLLTTTFHIMFFFFSQISEIFGLKSI